MSSSLDTMKIFKSRQVLLDLMERQGYDVSSYTGFSVNEVNIMLDNNQLDMMMAKKDNPSQRVYVKYLEMNKSSVRAREIEDIIGELYDSDNDILKRQDMLYIVAKSGANDSIKQLLKEQWEKYKKHVIVEGIDHLQFNILNHSMVPPHHVIAETEVQEVMLRYNIKDKTEFPEISKFDPVARAIGIRPGEVCRILRPSKTAVMTTYYRVCVT